MAIALDLTGRAVLVTGGTRGIGRGIAQRFLAAGADVLVCSRKPPEAVPTSGGRPASFVAADVRDVAQIEKTIQTAVEKFGRLDVLVNNAGGAPFALAATASPRFGASIIELNLIAALNFSQRANAVMQGQDGGGCIINVTSISGLRPSPGTAAYGAAKAGLISLTGSLAVEWAPKVRVNAVSPGPVRTELSHLHYGDEEGIAAVGETIPMGRMAEAGDVGDACLYLSSPLAAYVTGANIVLHGGGERPAFLAASTAGKT